jgi:hypothetical protein
MFHPAQQTVRVSTVSLILLITEKVRGNHHLAVPRLSRIISVPVPCQQLATTKNSRILNLKKCMFCQRKLRTFLLSISVLIREKTVETNSIFFLTKITLYITT